MSKLQGAEPFLKFFCLILAALFLYRASALIAKRDPLDGLNLPPVPPATSAGQAANPPNSKTNPPPSAAAPDKPAEIPPDIEAHINRIHSSEILGPVPHPLPMELLGIAGPVAFIRAPDGQTGLMREGAELGGIKLLRISTNRVLIEHEGQKKELTLFSGFGSQSLLPDAKDKK